MNTFNSIVHEPQIVSFTPFQNLESETGALAAVTLAYGPVAIRAKLWRGNHGVFLSMPRRKGSDEKWWDQAYFRDRSMHDHFQRLAMDRYNSYTSEAAVAA